MSKKRKDITMPKITPPSLSESVDPATVNAGSFIPLDAEQAVTVEATAEVSFDDIALVIPLGEVTPGFLPRNRVDVQSLTQENLIVLSRMLTGLRRNFAMLNNGKPVDCLQDAIKWVLESVARESPNAAKR